MVRVIRIDEAGRETASIELDDFTVEILYADLDKKLQAAAVARQYPSRPAEVSPEERKRRQRIITRIYG